MCVIVELQGEAVTWSPSPFTVSLLLGRQAVGKSSLLHAMEHRVLHSEPGASFRYVNTQALLHRDPRGTWDRQMGPWRRIEDRLQEITASSYRPNKPWVALSDGEKYLCSLLSLVLQSTPQQVLCVDDFAERLDPFAARFVLQEMRRRCEEEDRSFVITTHVESVIDQFRSHDEQSDADEVWILYPKGMNPRIQRLVDIHDPAWLAQFSLGHLWSVDRLGFPKTST